MPIIRIVSLSFQSHHTTQKQSLPLSTEEVIIDYLMVSGYYDLEWTSQSRRGHPQKGSLGEVESFARIQQ